MFIKPHVDSPYGHTPEWQESAKPFVPCIIASLKSSDPCIQMAAVVLLRDIADERAVEPLLDLLKRDNGSSWAPQEARMALASTFKSPLVVPYLVQAFVPPAMDPEHVAIDVQALREGIKDPRLFEALYTLFHTPSLKPMNRGLVLEVLVSQRYGPECDGRLYQIFKEIKNKPDVFLYTGADRLIIAIASEKTFDELESYYFGPHVSEIKLWTAVPLALKKVGGDKYLAFLKRLLSTPQEKSQYPWESRELFEELKKRVKPETPDGKDPLDWLKEQAGDWLPIAPAESVWPILEAGPKGGPKTDARQRAAYWERAALLFTHNPKVEFSIQWRLCEIYGPEGTDEPEKKLKALTAAIDNYTESLKGVTREQGRQPNDWVLQETVLKRQIAARAQQDVIRIINAAPAVSGNPLGAWKAELALPADASKRGLLSDPIGYLDYFGREGLLASVPSTVAIDLGPSRVGAIPFTIDPESQPALSKEDVVRVRLRLLFLPYKEGFFGTILLDIPVF